MANVNLELFKRSPLCQGMTDLEVQAVSALLDEKEMKTGTTVFIENMPGECLYLIQKGGVKITKMLAEGDEQVLVDLEAGEVFGEMAILDGAPRSATARVTQDAHLLRIGRVEFEALCGKSPQVGLKLMRNIIRVFCRRIRENNEEYREMVLLGLGRKG